MNYNKILTTLVICFNVYVAFAQWQSDNRLTSDPLNSFTSYNNASCVAAAGNNIHVAWYDNRAGRYQIFYKRSTNSGLSWSADTEMTAFNSGADYGTTMPSIAASGQNVHLVFTRNDNIQKTLYYKHSTDGGNSWSSNTTLQSNSSLANPSICANGQDVHVAVQLSNGSVFYELSTDDGVSWGSSSMLTTNSSFSGFPSISSYGSNIGVVWEDSRDLNYEIYFKYSTDGGFNWSPDIRLTNDVNNSMHPSISIYGQLVNAVWQDDRDGNTEIYYKRSTDGGLNWGPDTRLTNNPDSSASPYVFASGQFVHVSWQDHRDGNWEIYYKRSTNGGVSWETDTRLTNNSLVSESPSISVSGSSVNVVWTDLRDGNPEIYFKQNPQGNVLGVEITSTQIPNSYSLYQNYPNPFNPSTKIKFDIPANVSSQTSNVKLLIYDALGREVSTLVNEELRPGSYEIEWNAAGYPSAVYLYKLSNGDFTQTKKLVLVK